MPALTIKFPPYCSSFKGKLEFFNRVTGTVVPHGAMLQAVSNSDNFLHLVDEADGEVELEPNIIVKFVADYMQEELDGELVIQS